jgi:hypothetical protein
LQLTGFFSPLTPFKSAFFTALFLRLYRHPPFPTQSLTCFTFFGWALREFEHPVLGIIRLFGDGRNFTGEVCGLVEAECRGIYFEWAVIVVAGVASWRGWRWDGGVTEWIVGKIVRDLWGGEDVVEELEGVVVDGDELVSEKGEEKV